MKQLYVIYTHNRFNQILIFTSYKKAYNWLKTATRLNDEQIKKEIIKTREAWQGFAEAFDLQQIKEA